MYNCAPFHLTEWTPVHTSVFSLFANAYSVEFFKQSPPPPDNLPLSISCDGELPSSLGWCHCALQVWETGPKPPPSGQITPHQSVSWPGISDPNFMSISNAVFVCVMAAVVGMAARQVRRRHALFTLLRGPAKLFQPANKKKTEVKF